MDIKLIKAPGENTLRIISERSKYKIENKPGAIGLVQGKLIEMISASDIAEKSVGVEVFDIRGSCPQNFVLLAIVGDMEEVKVALENIRAGGDLRNGNC